MVCTLNPKVQRRKQNKGNHSSPFILNIVIVYIFYFLYLPFQIPSWQFDRSSWHIFHHTYKYVQIPKRDMCPNSDSVTQNWRDWPPEEDEAFRAIIGASHLWLWSPETDLSAKHHCCKTKGSKICCIHAKPTGGVCRKWLPAVPGGETNSAFPQYIIANWDLSS